MRAKVYCLGVCILTASAFALGQGHSRLFTKLPDFVSTPDSMVVAPDGTLVVSCPNFATLAQNSGPAKSPAVLLKIDSEGIAHKWVDLPPMPETGRIAPMGMAFGPAGELYLVDNQDWAAGNGANGEINRGRILRLMIRRNQIVEFDVVAKGISHPNGIRYWKGNLYVTVSMLPKVKRPDGLLVSGLYRFPADARELEVGNTLDDKTLVASFVTQNRFTRYGLDGIVFDSRGNLYVGNFGDGTVYKLTLDLSGNLLSSQVFAKTDFDTKRDPAEAGFLAYAETTKLRTTDGICVDADGNLYVADFSNNSIDRVTPAGEISTLAHNGDTDGQAGELNEPGDAVIWNGRLIVANFDAVSGPDKVHTAHHAPATLSVIELK